LTTYIWQGSAVTDFKGMR